MSESIFQNVNEHCMSAIVEAAGSSRIVASDDIVDDKGIKLWSSGLEITPQAHERLLARKLKKPLETCLEVEGGVGPESLKQAAEAAMADPHIAQLAGARSAELITILSRLPLHSVVRLLLTTARNNGSGAFEHAVRAALVAGALGALSGKSGSSLQTLMLAGLLHDIGEAYINPAYLRTKRILSPKEWKHIIVHPHVGYMVLTEMTDYPTQVTHAVREHHERANGSGYPRKITQHGMCEEAQFLSVVTTVCGIAAGGPNACHRMKLGLHLVAGEYPVEILRLLAPLWKLQQDVELPQDFDPVAVHAACVDLYKRLEQANVVCTDLLKDAILLEHSRAEIERAQMLLGRLRIAVSSSGITQMSQPVGQATSDESFLEYLTVPAEVNWRARNLAREISFLVDLVPGAVNAKLLELIGLLDEDSHRHLTAPAEA